MKKTFTIAVLFLIFNLLNTQSQPWHYDFGTGTGIFTTSSSTTFLPVAPSGTARVRVGSAGGSFNLENQVLPFGSNSYLRIVAATSTSVNKFSIYDFTPSTKATIKFIVRLGNSLGNAGVTSGNFQFFLGDGATYSDNNGFNKAHIFAGIQFAFGSGGTLTTNVRNDGNWVTTGITSTLFSQGNDYIIEIYANNSTIEENYQYGTLQSLASNTWDLWVNGVIEGNDLPKDQLPDNTNLDSYMFIGQNSTGNVANIFLDEFDYHNDLAGTPLPVTMGSFEMYSAGRAATLNWSTTSEINNSGFDIERSIISGKLTTEWQKIASIPGNGTTSELKNYSYTDNNLKAGNYKYRLKQIDYNGNFEYFSPANADFVTIVKPNEFSLSQNYPNPSNPVSKIDYQIPFAGNVNITVFDITGKVVRVLVNGYQTADYHSVTFDGTGLASGIYFYRINGSSENSQFTKTMKMVLVK